MEFVDIYNMYPDKLMRRVGYTHEHKDTLTHT
jgi:hypothetical protein